MKKRIFTGLAFILLLGLCACAVRKAIPPIVAPQAGPQEFTGTIIACALAEDGSAGTNKCYGKLANGAEISIAWLGGASEFEISFPEGGPQEGQAFEAHGTYNQALAMLFIAVEGDYLRVSAMQ